MKKIVILLIPIIVLAALFLAWNNNKTEEFVPVADFNDCLNRGYNVMESYPRQCRTPDGEVFIEDIGNELEKMDLIRIDSPRPNTQIKSPLQIIGQARGYWFFEGDFPAKLLDSNGKELAVGYVTAQTGWMTEDFIPFEGILEFEAPATNRGMLILEKDNPSGLPENADELNVPVYFEE